jgi:hypothetical protein
VPRVVADHHPALGRVVDLSEQVVGEAARGPDHDRAVHPERPGAHLAPQTSGPEGELPVDAGAHGVLVGSVEQALQLLARRRVRVTGDPGAGTIGEHGIHARHPTGAPGSDPGATHATNEWTRPTGPTARTIRCDGPVHADGAAGTRRWEQVMGADQDGDNALAAFRHDARTPLHTILGFTHMLREQQLPADAARYVDHIELAGQQLERLIDALSNGPAADGSPPSAVEPIDE